MLTDKQIKALADAMAHRSVDSKYINAGYTYLGQFIAHDIIPETQGGVRQVSPHLNLDSLYGTATQPAVPVGSALFPIGPSVPGGPDDLPRKDGVAQIPERRNDDNVIVSQLHLLWQRFHNFTITSGCASNATQGRRLVTLVFQLLVVEDFLRLLLAPAVFESCFRFDQRWLNFDPSRIPPEFSHAAFRFGHSLVRESYNSFRPDVTSDVDLKEIFRANENLPPELEINWGGFFDWPVPQNDVQGAMVIDPFIAPDMAAVRVPSRGPEPVNVIYMNLRAGNAAGLPPGKTYAAEWLPKCRNGLINGTFKDNVQLDALQDLGELEKVDLSRSDARITIDNLPLWPYVLLEAMQASKGKHLGTLGSLICAEVLANSIVKAPTSIYRNGWPGIDNVLDTLGELGVRIQAVRRAYAASAGNGRTFCFRHILELVLNPDHNNNCKE